VVFEFIRKVIKPLVFKRKAGHLPNKHTVLSI